MASSTRSSHCCSLLHARAQRMFSSACCPSTPKRSATARTRSGRNVPLPRQLKQELDELTQCQCTRPCPPRRPGPLAAGWRHTECGTVVSEVSCGEVFAAVQGRPHLAGTELAVDLGDALGVDAAAEHAVDSLGARADCEDCCTALGHLDARREAGRLRSARQSCRKQLTSSLAQTSCSLAASVVRLTHLQLLDLGLVESARRSKRDSCTSERP